MIVSSCVSFSFSTGFILWSVANRAENKDKNSRKKRHFRMVEKFQQA
jgi:hypothetical protein